MNVFILSSHYSLRNIVYNGYVHSTYLPLDIINNSDYLYANTTLFYKKDLSIYIFWYCRGSEPHMLGYNCIYVCRGLPGLAKPKMLGMPLCRSLPTPWKCRVHYQCGNRHRPLSSHYTLSCQRG